MSRKDLRDGRIPQKAVENGDFVIDIGDISNYLFNDPDLAEERSIMTANNIIDTGMSEELMRFNRPFQSMTQLTARVLGK